PSFPTRRSSDLSFPLLPHPSPGIFVSLGQPGAASLYGIRRKKDNINSKLPPKPSQDWRCSLCSGGRSLPWKGPPKGAHRAPLQCTVQRSLLTAPYADSYNFSVGDRNMRMWGGVFLLLSMA